MGSPLMIVFWGGMNVRNAKLYVKQYRKTWQNGWQNKFDTQPDIAYGYGELI
jgi:hypothetical protein